MKKSIQSTATPIGYTGKGFNQWQRNLQREIDKLRNTDLSVRYKIN